MIPRAVVVAVFLASLGPSSPSGSAARPLDALSMLQCRALLPWAEGGLDIHQISTGRGNAAFVVMPDGTTMLFDAGAAADGIPFTDIRPNASRSPGAWIARYVEVMGPVGRPARLDFAVLSHLHGDHMGQATDDAPTDASGSYRLTGITEVATLLPVGTLIDRGWPDYPVVPPDSDDPTFANYQAFIRHQRERRGLDVEAIRVGARDQIVLRGVPGRYGDFEVRNVAANGLVWTGQDDGVVNRFPAPGVARPEDAPTENMSSIGLRLTYGAFDYFTGGDMPGIPSAGAPAWHAIEPVVAHAIGETDVHVVNHHGSIDPASPEFLLALRSQVIVLPSWSPTHPSQDSLKRMMEPRLYSGPRDIFATRVAEPTKVSIGARATRFASDHGHVVVRVAPGGATFQVFVLDDEQESFCVTGAFGPYTSALQ